MTASNVPVFKLTDWTSPAPNRWEAHSTTSDLDGPLSFAVAVHLDTSHGPHGFWNWRLFHETAEPTDRHLRGCGRGASGTLAVAKRDVEALARWRRDHPDDVQKAAALAKLDEHSIVTCDRCGTSYDLGGLLQARAGLCETLLADETICSSNNFDGYDIDLIAQAVTE